MEAPKAKHKRSKPRWLKRVGIILAALLLVPTILFTIGWFNRDLLIDELQDWYNENNSGSLEIGEVDATFLSGFPNVGFTIRDIHQTGFDSILDKSTDIFIEKTQVSIAATDLLKGNIQFRNIEIDNAEIHTEVISEKTRARYIQLKKSKQAHPKSGLRLPPWLHQERMNFRLSNVRFISKDSMLNKYFNLEIHRVLGRIRSENEKISGKLNFKVKVKALGFNTEKGSYINGAIVSGSPDFILDQQVNRLSVAEFPLEIGGTGFTTGADFDFNGSNAYSFSLQNPETDFQQLKELLPESISSILSPYEIGEPISSKLRLEGEFRYGDVPFIDAEFSTSENRMKIGDSLEITGVQFDGYITNTLARDLKDDKQKPSKGDIRVFFREFQGSSDDIKIAANNAYYQSSEEAANFVEASLKMSGSNESLARLMQTDNFGFKGGNFNLDTQISGDISNAAEVFDFAAGTFSLNNTRVVLQKNNLQLPVKRLQVQLNNKQSILEELIINLPNGEELAFQGTIKNISSLMADDPIMPAAADVRLNTEALNINALIAATMENIPQSERSRNRSKTLHETFEAIYKKFQPRFRLDLKTVEYDSIMFNDLKADIRLLNAETVQLDQLIFKYNEAVTSLRGSMRIPKGDANSKNPLYLNVDARSSGPVGVFQDLFNIQLVEIKTGEFVFSGNIAGNIQKLEEILNKANGDLELVNTKFHYPEADLDIVLDSLKVSLHDAEIYLDRFVIEAGDHHPFALKGRVTEYPGFLLDSAQSDGKIFLTLDAEFIDLNDWLETINSMEKDTTAKTLKNRELAVILADIYRFDPEFRLKVDTLKYKDLVSEDITARVYFENDSILKLEDLRIRYKDSEAVINGMIAAHYRKGFINDNPFNFEFSAVASGRSRDLNDLLQTVNFDLRSGNFSFNGSYKGEARDLEILNSNARGELILGTTMVDIKGTDIEVPVDSLHLSIENNLATLKRLDVELPGKSSIDITGEIDNFSNFINNEEAVDSHRSSFSIKSPYLDSNDIKEFVGGKRKKKDSSKINEFEIRNFKDVISNLNSSYLPSAQIEIDSLVYDNLAVSDFNSKIGFNDSGDIRIDDTGFRYSGGSADLMLEAGLNTLRNLPVRIRMDIRDIDLEKLVKDLDYFKIEELRKTEKIGGKLDLKFDLKGILNEQGKVEINSLNGSVEIFLEELALHDYDPLMEKVVLLKEERFEQLEFRPIRQSFEVKDGNIRIPRTQIQSSAMQVFVEGEFQPGESYDIWISIPWNNILKSRDGIELPRKISFDKSGAKFYLQIVQDKESEKAGERKLKKKFRLGNRKLKKKKEN